MDLDKIEHKARTSSVSVGTVLDLIALIRKQEAELLNEREMYLHLLKSSKTLLDEAKEAMLQHISDFGQVQDAVPAAPAAPVVAVASIENNFSQFWSLIGVWRNANPGDDADIKANEIVKYIDAYTAAAVAQAVEGAQDALTEVTAQRDALRDRLAAQASAPVAATTQELEAVIACLGDDAARLQESEPEVAENMRAAERLLETLAAPQQHAQAAQPIEVEGLGSITNEEDGVLTLRFKNDDAAQAFFCAYQPTVDCRDMPRPNLADRSRMDGNDAQAALSDEQIQSIWAHVIIDGEKPAYMAFARAILATRQPASAVDPRIVSQEQLPDGSVRTVKSYKLAAAPVAPPEFCRDPDGDLCLDWRVGDKSISVSFSPSGVVAWTADGASGSEQVGAPVAAGQTVQNSPQTRMNAGFSPLVGCGDGETREVGMPRAAPVATAVAVGVPDGWQLVPKTPTAEMIDAWELAPTNSTASMTSAQATLACATSEYQAMLAAAPQPPADAAPAFPPRDTTKSAEQQGMFEKFRVQRTDGSDAPGGKHHGCKYFVIDLDHDQYARAAMRAYAAACRATHPLLADDIEAEWGKADGASVDAATFREAMGAVQAVHQQGRAAGIEEAAKLIEPMNEAVAETVRSLNK